MVRFYLDNTPPPKRGRMPAHPRNRDKDPEAYDAANNWQADMQHRIEQTREQDKAYAEEQARRNEEAARELNRRKDVVMSNLSDIATSTPFTGNEYIDAANQQRQEKIDKWHDIRHGMEAAAVIGENVAAGYGVLRGLAHLRRLGLRAATRTTGNAVSRNTMTRLSKWNKIVNKIDAPQATMNGIGATVDGYQWITADNGFDRWENAIETGANTAGFVGGMNWFRNLPYLRRIGGNKIDNVLDGLGYGAATWDIVKQLPPLSGVLEHFREQSKQKENK